MEGSRWGELILPAPSEQCDRSESGLRVVVFAAFRIGIKLLDGVVCYERDRPDTIRPVAVSTDDAVEDVAKIGLQKRLWRFYSPEERLAQTADLIDLALKSSLPVFTGELKSEWFRNQLKEWAPDLIIVAGCGQILDEDLLTIPKLGTFNFHPADLPSGHGAGPQPYQDLVDRNDPWTRWTVHKVTPKVDSGPVVGVSCPIFVADAEGRVSSEPDKVLQRMAEIIPEMVEILFDSIAVAGNSTVAIDFEACLSEEIKQKMRSPLSG